MRIGRFVRSWRRLRRELCVFYYREKALVWTTVFVWGAVIASLFVE